MIDLMSAVQAAVYASLAASVPAGVADVFDVVPEGFLGNFVQVGDIECTNESAKGEQGESFEVQVNFVYLGKDRGVLLAMMHAGRVALDGQTLEADDVQFSEPRFLGGVADSVPIRTAKGLLYTGVSAFEIFAEPA